MVDRVSLLKTLEPVIQPTGAQREAIRIALDKALAEAVIALPYEAVAGLSDYARTDLEDVINLYSEKQAKQLAAKWEPGRKLDADVSSHVKRDLLELLHMKRELYSPITASLEEAQGDKSRYLNLVRYTVPTKDCEKLLKRWDKELSPFPKKRKEIVDRLIALLDGETPTEKLELPVKEPTKARKDPQTASRGSKNVPKAKAA